MQIYATASPRKSREFDPQLLGNAGRLLIGELRANRVVNFHKDWPTAAHAEQSMPFFGQELFLLAQITAGLSSAIYQKALATSHRFVRADGLDALFSQHQLAALVSPSRNPA